MRTVASTIVTPCLIATAGIDCKKTPLVSQPVLMVVPSLSWQKDRVFYSIIY
eukprot:COSAG06_NODE_4517_length_4188_cov_1.672536_2_plen_52_part_00